MSIKEALANLKAARRLHRDAYRNLQRAQKLAFELLTYDLKK